MIKTVLVLSEHSRIREYPHRQRSLVRKERDDRSPRYHHVVLVGRLPDLELHQPPPLGKKIFRLPSIIPGRDR
jgi:hypothetical protein